MLRQRKDGVDDELTFSICRKKATFGINDFALLTRLECGKLPNVNKSGSKQGALKQNFFPQIKKITCKEFDTMFATDLKASDDERVKLAKVYILQNILLGK